MRAPVLGPIFCEPGYGCARCGLNAETNVLTNLLHDLRCWGVETALYNLRVRLLPPDWFMGD